MNHFIGDQNLIFLKLAKVKGFELESAPYPRYDIVAGY